jgi:hypothetical protein
MGRDPKPMVGVAPSKDLKFSLILSSEPIMENNFQINIPTTY